MNVNLTWGIQRPLLVYVVRYAVIIVPFLAEQIKTSVLFLHRRKELKHLWDKCFFSTEERMEFSPAFDGKTMQQ